MRSSFGVGTVLFALCVVVALNAATTDTRLIDAAKSGNTAAVTSLLRQRVPVDAAEPDGTTALHWATRLDRVDMVQALLRGKAPVNVATRYGVTPLMQAAVNGNAQVVDLLLKAGADVNATGADGETVLMLAARTGRPDAIQLLIAKGANVNATETWHGETALMWAAAENHPEAVALLAKSGADLNAKSTIPDFPKVKVDNATMVVTALPKGGFTALLLAARQGAQDGVRALAEAGADLNATDPDGTSALNMAIINAHNEVAALLVEKGADLKLGDAAGMTPLYAAIDMRHQEPLINRPLAKPSGPMTPLDLVKVLLAHGADPNARLKTPLLMRQHNGGDASLNEGATPLMRAAKVSDVTTMSLLLEKGADPNLRLRNQGTALMIAASRQGRNAGPEENTIAAMKLLIDKGADPNLVNDNGETALHIAVARGDALVRFLAENGTRLDIKDKFGRTPLDVAMGVPGGAGGGRGRGGRGGPPTAGTVRESTAALLKELMKTP
ncbi:MAG TPA: ankyrin repeat domain-containing protein [Vicinamibacterales bacterium]|nr:ankyrin repeat domain-containing protein [Vicinamibacterales bacterium]